MLDWPTNIRLSFNVAPTSIIPAFLEDGGQAMRWSLTPPWAKETNKYATFNARLESGAEKPAFRHAWRSSQRCLIPAQGYYEWRTENGAKQPYFVRAASGEPLVFAGRYEPAPQDGEFASCTILTRPAAPSLESLHTRMPIMFSTEACGDWFEATPKDAVELAGRILPSELLIYPVSRQVNKPGFDDSQCVEKTSLGGKG